MPFAIGDNSKVALRATSPAPATVDLSIVLPCLNEAGSVGACVARAAESAAAAGFSHEVIVCDNGSTDSSAREAAQAGARVVSEPRRGYGSALRAGIAAAGGRVLVLADADGSYPLERAPAFAERVGQTGGLVLGSRFRGQIVKGSMPLSHRLIGTPATRLFLRLFYGVHCSDPHCGMRAMTRETFEAVSPLSTGMEFAIEMVVNAGRRSVPIVEIPIMYRVRAGRSKLRTIPDGWRLFEFFALHSPTLLYLVPGFAAMGLGGGTLAWLAEGDRTIGSLTLSVNTMVVASLATVFGYQIVTLGICARTYLLGELVGEREPSLRWLQRHFTLGRGLMASLAVTGAALVLLGIVVGRWIASDLGSLSPSEHRLALLGLTTGMVGLQTFFASFMLSLFLAARRG